MKTIEIAGKQYLIIKVTVRYIKLQEILSIQKDGEKVNAKLGVILKGDLFQYEV